MTLIEAKVEAALLSRKEGCVYIYNNPKKEEVEISTSMPKDRSALLTVYEHGSEWDYKRVDEITGYLLTQVFNAPTTNNSKAVAPDPKPPKLSHSHTGTKGKPPRKVATTDVSRKLKESIAKENLKKYKVGDNVWVSDGYGWKKVKLRKFEIERGFVPTGMHNETVDLYSEHVRAKKPTIEAFKKEVEKDPVVRRATKEINKNTSALKAALEKYKNSKPPVNAPAKNVVVSVSKKGKNKR